MIKVSIIVQRYGKEVSGGGEFYARALARHLIEKYEVTVLTSTSLEYLDWDQYYPSGESVDEGVRVIRFENRKGRPWERFQKLCDELCDVVRAGGRTDTNKDLEWADAEGPYCPGLIRYIEKHRDEYDVFLVFTYIYFTAIRSLPLVANKAIFIPTAHDDIWMRFSIFRHMFFMPRWIGFLTNGERNFVRSFYKNDEVPGDIIGCGVDIPQTPEPQRFREKYGLYDLYLVFIGRIDVSKSCDEMIQFFQSYKRCHPSKLKLVLIGKASAGFAVPEEPDIICTGFVSEQEKFDGIAGALATISPSKFESLCIALLESFACGVPALVNGQCEILREHCDIGKCGLYYTNEEEFAAGLNYLIEHPKVREGMGKNALKYICEFYTWERVMTRLTKMIDDIANNPKDQMKLMEMENKEFTGRNVLSDRQINGKIIEPDQSTEIRPVFEKGSVTICFSSSDYFAPMCGVAVSSLIENASPDRNYEIFIIIQDMSVQHINLLSGLASGHDNVVIRFIDVNRIVKSYCFSLASYYTPFTFYRLLIPKLMCRYDKVLYLDSDMVINHDVGELYDTDIRNYFLGATLDLTVLCWQLQDNTSGMHNYLEELDLLEPGTYLQGGVSLYNIKEFNKHFTTEYLLQKATERSYLTCDQDLINICCKGHIKFVDQKWNMVNMKNVHIDLYNKILPQIYYDAYIEARRDPYIVHYGAQLLPCFEPGVDYYPLFWAYAKKTPFYEQLLSILTSVAAEKANKELQMVRSSVSEMETDIWDAIGHKKKKKFFEVICDTFFPRGSKRREWLKKLAFGKMKIQGDASTCSVENLMKMCLNGSGEREKDRITIYPGAMIYGPYIKMTQGEHHVILVVDFQKAAAVEGVITAEAGKIQIASQKLRQGRNDFFFELDRPRKNVEVIINNTTDSNITLLGIQFD